MLLGFPSLVKSSRPSVACSTILNSHWFGSLYRVSRAVPPFPVYLAPGWNCPMAGASIYGENCIYNLGQSKQNFERILTAWASIYGENCIYHLEQSKQNFRRILTAWVKIYAENCIYHLGQTKWNFGRILRPVPLLNLSWYTHIYH